MKASPNTPDPTDSGDAADPCSRFERSLEALLARELPSAEGAAHHAHAAACVRCAASLATASAIVAELRILPVRAHAAASWAGIRRELARERSARPASFLAEAFVVAALAAVWIAAVLRPGAAVAARFIDGVQALVPDTPFARLLTAAAASPGFAPGVVAVAGALAAAAMLPLLRRAPTRPVVAA